MLADRASVVMSVDLSIYCCTSNVGNVEYNTDGFFKKNKNELRQEAVDLLVSSTDKLIQILLPNDADSAAGGSDMAAYFASLATSSGRESTGAKSHVRRRSQLQQKTVGSHFKSQLASALTTIRASEPHFGKWCHG
jgi:myosin heavy subunit